MAHLRGLGTAERVQIDGGGVVEAPGRVTLPGKEWFVGGELRNFLGYGHGLRRSPGDALVHETEGNKVWVSAVIVGMQVVAREVRGKQQHGTAVPSPTSGCRARARAAASSQQRLRPRGGARASGGECGAARERQWGVGKCEVRARV